MMGIVAVAAFAAAAAEAPTAAITATGRRARVPAHRLILDVHHLVVGVEQLDAVAVGDASLELPYWSTVIVTFFEAAGACGWSRHPGVHRG